MLGVVTLGVCITIVPVYLPRLNLVGYKEIVFTRLRVQKSPSSEVATIYDARKLVWVPRKV